MDVNDGFLQLQLLSVAADCRHTALDADAGGQRYLLALLITAAARCYRLLLLAYCRVAF